MVLSKSSPTQNGAKISKKFSSINSKDSKVTQRLKTVTNTSKQAASNPKPKKSKKINKLLANYDKDTIESSQSSLQHSNKTSTVTTKSKVKQKLDTYDFNEINESFENFQIFNQNDIKTAGSISSSSSESSYTNKITLNYENLVYDDNHNNTFTTNQGLNDVNYIHNKFRKELLIARNKLYHEKLTYLKYQLVALKNHQKQQHKHDQEQLKEPSNISILIPECTNYFQDYLDETLKLEKESNENIMIVKMWYERQQTEIERQIDIECLKAKEEYEKKLKELKTNLVNQQIELKKQLEVERDLLDLNYDPNDQHDVLPPMKRKLRRRNTNYENKSNSQNKCLKNSNINNNNNSNNVVTTNICNSLDSIAIISTQSIDI